MTMTITEALAEIKTVDKRINSKKRFVAQYLVRLSNVIDPLEKDGGSAAAISAEMQAISDLENRIVSLRRGIQKANDETELSVDGQTKSISDWLVWRREVSANRVNFLNSLLSNMRVSRSEMRRYSQAQMQQQDQSKEQLIVNIDEKALAKELETLEGIISKLDGQLSLKNATVLVNV